MGLTCGFKVQTVKWSTRMNLLYEYSFIVIFITICYLTSAFDIHSKSPFFLGDSHFLGKSPVLPFLIKTSRFLVLLVKGNFMHVERRPFDMSAYFERKNCLLFKRLHTGIDNRC